MIDETDESRSGMQLNENESRCLVWYATVGWDSTWDITIALPGFQLQLEWIVIYKCLLVQGLSVFLLTHVPTTMRQALMPFELVGSPLDVL